MSRNRVDEMKALYADPGYMHWVNHFADHIADVLGDCPAWDEQLDGHQTVVHYTLHAALAVVVDRLSNEDVDPDLIARMVTHELVVIYKTMEKYPAARREALKGMKFDRTRAGK
jgi:hypothetical protein